MSPKGFASIARRLLSSLTSCSRQQEAPELST